MLVLPIMTKFRHLAVGCVQRSIGRPEEMDSGGDGVSTGSLEI
jgi:hypothetical protein